MLTPSIMYMAVQITDAPKCQSKQKKFIKNGFKTNSLIKKKNQ